MITIKQIATMLGVSTTTVSNVIHGKTDQMTEATVEKVEKLIKEYNYIPNISARNLANQSSKIIGVGMINDREIVENYLMDPFIGEIVGSIERELAKHGYYMMLYFSKNVEELVNTISAWSVDGLLFLGMVQEYDTGIDYNIDVRLKKPIVVIDSYIDELAPNTVSVRLEDYKGGYLMGEYFLQQGHSKIAFLTDDYKGNDYQRYLGFVDAVRDRGNSSVQVNCIKASIQTNVLESLFDEVYEECMKYTAIFCTSDYYALNFMKYLDKKGIRVPDDISLAGFDDNIYSRICTPGITTIHQDPTMKGKIAVEHMMKLLQQEEIREHRIDLPVELVIRESVKQMNL